MRTIRLLIGWLCIAAIAEFTVAQAPVVQAPVTQSTVTPSAAPEVTLQNLNRPCGIAFRPGSTADRFDVFIAETGAGRVVRWSAASRERPVEVIKGFQVSDQIDRFAPLGPVSLVFLDPGMLVVGASTADGGSLVRSYELSVDEPLEASADQAAASSDAAKSVCLSLTRTRANEFIADALVLTIHTPDRGDVLKSRVQAGIVGQPKQFLNSEPNASPLAITTSPTGRIVVAGANGELTFYNPIDAHAELRLSTKLQHIVGLAYSPTTENLYAADFEQGIYRIDDVSQAAHPACKPVRIADIDQASALAFAPDGSLYVVTFGDGKNGTLQILSGNL
jgi:hypothetical protein